MSMPPMSDEVSIEARGLGKSYGQNWALRGVDLAVAPGEAVAVFGGNGAGKSTLLRLLATLTSPSLGTLLIMGRDTARHARAVRPSLGVLMHQTYLYGELTAAENLALYARLYGLGGVSGIRAVGDKNGPLRDALSAVGLLAVADRRVRELSRGMQQRLALARATVHRPALLLLDEPDAGLDAEGRAYLAQIIAAGREWGQATVLATHQMELGLAVCGRALILSRGKVALSAPVEAYSVEEWRAHYSQATQATSASARAL